MTGYAFVIGACVACGVPFTFNPHSVPSITVKGNREPICARCVEAANVIRAANGLDAIVPLPDAYDPIPESEL